MISSRRATSFAAVWVLAVAALVAAPGVTAEAGPQADRKGGHHGSKCNASRTSVEKLLRCVTVSGVMEHERAFQRIADRNDGTRSAGTSGYDASADYVKARMKRAGYRVTVQEFDVFAYSEVGPSELQQTDPTPTTYVEGTDFGATPQSEPGDITAAVTPVDLQLGVGNTSTSGCQPEDFAGFPAGNIALVQRGECTFEIKGENAAAAGASGILFFNQGNTAAADRQGIPAVTLGNGYTGGIPALSATYALGAQLSAVAGLEMRLFANVSRVKSVTSNILAESRRGDDSNVVMAGAHLDSVPEGPGINDNGSGSSALLEVAEQLRKVKTKNTLRFAWWGAEEGGLVGSTYYVNDLAANAPEDLTDIEMYLNFDMVASPNYGLFRYDGDGSDFGLVGPDGSDEIEALFARYYAERDIPSEASPFNGRSDYQAFINNGIPAGGLFTGAEGLKTAEQQVKWGGTAGVAYDPCYHQACDTIANLSREALRINADAIAYVVYLYATREEAINQDAMRSRGTRSAGPFA